MKINPTIFREYDIRGVAGIKFTAKAIAEYEKWYGKFPGITITLEVSKAIGKGYGTIIRRGGGKRIVVGHEIRPFADELTNAFIAGVRHTGCDITDLGVSLTPIVYFHTAYGRFDGGVNVTGSHNVYFFNGFKLMKREVIPLFGEELQKMRRLIEAENFIADQEGSYQKIDGYPIYKDYVLKRIKLARALKIVIDCGNGSAGLFAPDLFRSLGCEVIELYTNPDATFPNHAPDPEPPQNLLDLGKKVKESGAGLGVAFDADGDRVGFVDEKGETIPGDLTLLLLAKDALSRHPGKKVLFDVKCSRLLEEFIPKFGGIPLMHRTGHAPIKSTMKKDPDIIFGGEISGHFFLVEDYFGIDDGLFAAALVLELYSHLPGAFSALFQGFPKRARTPEIKLPCDDREKFQIVEQIKENFKSEFPAITIDGVRIKVSDTGWGLIRASNTSPYLTIRIEGKNENEAIKIKNILADELEKYPEVTDRLNRKELASLTGKLGWV
jgi:phosphomannomutase/phosphoglucomutase